MSERALRSAQMRVALTGTGTGRFAVEERAERALWVSRAALLEIFAERDNAFTAGMRVWEVAEPWVAVIAELAQDPSVLLAELPTWARLLDRHSSIDVLSTGRDTQLIWSNAPGFPPEASECEFRLGALRALLSFCSFDETVLVHHTECVADGGNRCCFEVPAWIPCRDVRHERALREASLLQTDLEGREALQRRLAEFADRHGPFPDVRELQGVRRFMDEVEDIILVFDHDLMVLDGNRAALRQYGMTLAELRGQSAQDLLTDASWLEVRELVPRLFEVGGMRGILVEARTRVGVATLEVSARVAANAESIVCIARDITERLRLERELGERNEQLRVQNQRVIDADRMKSEFLANVSHELTTPLTSIKGFATLLRGDVAAEVAGGPRLGAVQRAEFLGLVEREAARMTEMIRGLLELSNIEAGGVALARRPAALGAIVHECLQILKPRLDEAGFAVDLALDPSLPLAQLDPDRIKQVVLNLLENSLKFSTRGARIRISTFRDDEAVEVRVRNPCQELGPDDLGRIFDRFVQRDGSYSRKYGGVGLGLNLVRAIAELHGGQAWAELPFAGTVEFVVRLPLHA
ncbi:MAG: ATP-binding protein [Myxococcota bacterium]